MLFYLLGFVNGNLFFGIIQINNILKFQRTNMAKKIFAYLLHYTKK